MIKHSSSWFVRTNQSIIPKIRLFCLPYAGGNTSTYTSWSNHISMPIETIPIQYPGRSNRLLETPYSSMDSLVQALFDEIKLLLDIPYILLGHSLGSLVGFELLRKINQFGLNMPEHFIASGSRAPHLLSDKESIFKLPTNEFINELRNLNGTPEVILQSEELMELCLPSLRADFEIAYTYKAEIEKKLDLPISILGGIKDDDISMKDLEAWQNHFVKTVDVKMFPGDHFFIESDKKLVLDHITGIFINIINKMV